MINCYKFHGRDDLLPAFNEEDDKSNILLQQGAHISPLGQGQSHQQTVGVVRISSTDSSKGNSSPPQIIATSPSALATATHVGVEGVRIFFKLEYLPIEHFVSRAEGNLSGIFFTGSWTAGKMVFVVQQEKENVRFASRIRKLLLESEEQHFPDNFESLTKFFTFLFAGGIQYFFLLTQDKTKIFLYFCQFSLHSAEQE